MSGKRDEYVAAVGKEPPAAPDEYQHQWAYRGTREEREQLANSLLDAPAGEQPTQEESLF